MAAADVPVPASTRAVKEFLADNRDKFVRASEAIREKITSQLNSVDVYKIYGRADKQGSEPLKNARKVRLKFNEYFQRLGQAEGSLFSVPDIIGFTIVVTFPSDISNVCSIIDQMIDDKELGRHPDAPPPKPVESGDKNPIKTKFGRAITSGGYFACHYNVVQIGPGGGNKPQCEIQIKTILHDAWGAKSHDLTYKPSSKISSDLTKTFEVLGDMLAQVDEQSDIVRNSIVRTAAARQKRKHQVLSATISEAVKNIVKDEDLTDIVNAIEAKGSNVDWPFCRESIDVITKKFENKNYKDACLTYVFLSFSIRNAALFQQALEAIEEWFENEDKDFKKAYARSVSALALFTHNDTPGAIDESEHAISILDAIDVSLLGDEEVNAVRRLSHSIYSSLAYYHAEAVGSHDGRLGDAASNAKVCLTKAADLRKLLGVNLTLDDDNDKLVLGMSDPVMGWATFSSLDTEAFVRIQTAQDVTDVQRTRERLDFLHKERPPGYSAAASALFQFHDFCARDRLAELERI